MTQQEKRCQGRPRWQALGQEEVVSAIPTVVLTGDGGRVDRINLCVAKARVGGGQDGIG